MLMPEHFGVERIRVWALEGKIVRCGLGRRTISTWSRPLTRQPWPATPTQAGLKSFTCSSISSSPHQIIHNYSCTLLCVKACTISLVSFLFTSTNTFYSILATLYTPSRSIVSSSLSPALYLCRITYYYLLYDALISFFFPIPYTLSQWIFYMILLSIDFECTVCDIITCK
jgi:hypothetical protein